MSYSNLSAAFKETEKDYKDQLPPWDESDSSQKFLHIVLKLGIYIPVIVLWVISISLYSIFIFMYLLPNVEYTSDHPSLYYWNTSTEYENSKIKAWTIFSFFTLFFILLIISIVRTMTTGPGIVPASWSITSEKQSIIEKRYDGNERICIKCEMKKPDRTHHCRQCENCTLRMDHHCNWIGNCIGFNNYKYFICMLMYSVLATGVFVGSFWETVVVDLNNENNDIMYCFFVVLNYSLAIMIFFVLLFFLSFHLWLISKNYTTIEYCEKNKKKVEKFEKSPYSLGVYGNFKQILGDNPFLWFIPVTFKSDCDGTSFVNTIQ